MLRTLLQRIDYWSLFDLWTRWTLRELCGPWPLLPFRVDLQTQTEGWATLFSEQRLREQHLPWTVLLLAHRVAVLHPLQCRRRLCHVPEPIRNTGRTMPHANGNRDENKPSNPNGFIVCLRFIATVSQHLWIVVANVQAEPFGVNLRISPNCIVHVHN